MVSVYIYNPFVFVSWFGNGTSQFSVPTENLPNLTLLFCFPLSFPLPAPGMELRIGGTKSENQELKEE